MGVKTACDQQRKYDEEIFLIMPRCALPFRLVFAQYSLEKEKHCDVTIVLKPGGLQLAPIQNYRRWYKAYDAKHILRINFDVADDADKL